MDLIRQISTILGGLIIAIPFIATSQEFPADAFSRQPSNFPASQDSTADTFFRHRPNTEAAPEIPAKAFSSQRPITGNLRGAVSPGEKVPLPSYNMGAWCAKYEKEYSANYRKYMAKRHGDCLQAEESSKNDLTQLWGLMSKDARGFCEFYLKKQERESYKSLLNCVVQANMKGIGASRSHRSVPPPPRFEINREPLAPGELFRPYKLRPR